MQITIVTLGNAIYPVDVATDLTLQNFCGLIESVTGISTSRLTILHNGRPLLDKSKDLSALGLVNGDIVIVQEQIEQTRSTVPTIDFSSVRLGRTPVVAESVRPTESVRQMLLASPRQLALLREANPRLAEAIQDAANFERIFTEQSAEAQQKEQERLRLLSADPLDPEVQRRIAEDIQQHNIDNSMEHAMEYMPEAFSQVIMLYINCRVNGYSVKAFVDSGAQMTIMSQSCAQRCNIERLMDRRWAGIAKGVGEQRILGRIHMGQIQIENDFIANSFSVLEDQPMDLLIGLDLLKRHQCIIDLRHGKLVIGTTGTETNFLSEAELPTSARLNAEFSSTSDSAAAHDSSSANNAVKTDSSINETKINILTQHGFSKQAAIQALKDHHGDVDAALADLLQRSQ